MDTAVQSAAPERPALPAFEALFRAEYGFVWRCVTRLGVVSDAVDDAVQEVFVTAYRRQHTFAGRGNARAWLAGIARRVAFRHRRSDERRTRRRRALAQVVSPPEDLDDWMQRREAETFLENFLERLDPDKREVFVLCDLEGIAGRDAARVLGINANTASARLRAARLAFAKACERAERGRGPRLAETIVGTGRSLRPPRRASMTAWAALVPRLQAAPTATAVATGAAAGGGGLKALAVAGALALGGTAVAAATPAPVAPGPSVASVERVATSEPRPDRRRVARDDTRNVPHPVPPPARVPARQVPTSSSPTQPAVEIAPDRTAQPAIVHESSLEREVAALERATDASERRDWAGAVEAAVAYRRQFQPATFGDEALALEVEALCRLGRTTEAKVVARREWGLHRAQDLIRRRCLSP